MTTNLKLIPNLDIFSFVKNVLPDKTTCGIEGITEKSEFFMCRLSDVKPDEFLNSPFIYDFFTIYFVEKGCIAKINQLKSLEIGRNEIFFSKPGEIKTWQKLDNPNGFLVAFTLDYLLLLIDDKNLINTFDYLMPNSRRKFSLDKARLKLYKTVFNELYKEFNTISKYSVELIKFWLFVILIKTNRMHANGNGTNGLGGYKKSSDFIYNKFILIMEQNFKDLASQKVDRPFLVREFADMLNINPTYLGECVRRASGKSAKSIINQRTMLLAKCQLLHTFNNISEIAYQIGFESSGYFIRFFKKYEGITPLDYRKKWQK
ncbi:helix-turn-helix domain-containing protein [uncultured Aquimarina sp.]|uniref:helix-turn-helix domain-containing protein n=1 Tax=uncultured Aquimarina sp. TaxID=575652 RepID=UPI00262BC225|nr:helix-turn-helix domain-containing protein [uncultured Aquimarina sp.]